MPQVYAIGSERGLEIGFAVSIPEDDYFDVETKARNRSIIPFINSKLPSPEDSLIVSLDRKLSQQGGWSFNSKTRLVPSDEGFNRFSSLGDMLLYLKSNGDVAGGGTVCRLFEERSLPELDLAFEFDLALENFKGLLFQCVPSSWDRTIRASQEAVEEASDDSSFDPKDLTDAKQKVFTEIARRQGQPKFRRELLEAYNGRCAISGTSVADVLEAAHIVSYNGPKTNHPTNGLLLRSDLHTLFDLKLITVDPSDYRICVSEILKTTQYWIYNGKLLTLPTAPRPKPNAKYLSVHFLEAQIVSV